MKKPSSRNHWARFAAAGLASVVISFVSLLCMFMAMRSDGASVEAVGYVLMSLASPIVIMLAVRDASGA